MKIIFTEKDEVYKIEKKDLSDIKTKLSTCEQNLLICNKLESIEKGDFVTFTKGQIHHVKPNETLEIIAKKYNLSVEEIQYKNKITKTFNGQILWI